MVWFILAIGLVVVLYLIFADHGRDRKARQLRNVKAPIGWKGRWGP